MLFLNIEEFKKKINDLNFTPTLKLPESFFYQLEDLQNKRITFI